MAGFAVSRRPPLSPCRDNRPRLSSRAQIGAFFFRLGGCGDLVQGCYSIQKSRDAACPVFSSNRDEGKPRLYTCIIFDADLDHSPPLSHNVHRTRNDHPNSPPPHLPPPPP